MNLTKRKSRFGCTVFLLIAAVLSGCTDSQPIAMDLKNNEAILRAASQAAQLAIVDSAGQPIKNASVLIGSKRDDPFAGNFLISDESGNVALPEAWATPLPVTINASGFVRTTYLKVAPGARTLQVRKLPKAERVEVAGLATSFGELPKDGIVNVGLILTPITRAQALNFQAATFISPLTDQLKLPLGNKLDVPTNISVPKQKESYVVPFTLDKPTYRTFLEPPYDYRVLAMHARFPIKATIDGFKDGKTVFDLINHFEMLSFGYADISTKTPGVKQDIAVNQFQLAKSVKVTAPAFDQSLVMLTGVLAPMGPLYVPSDLKRIQSAESFDMKFPVGITDPGLVFSILRKNVVEGGYQDAKADEYTATLTSTTNKEALEFIPMIEAPKVQDAAVALQAPIAPAGITPKGMYLMRSGLNLLKGGRVHVVDRIPQWDILSEEWVDKVELPDIDSPIITTQATHRWEVMYLGDRDAQSKASVLTQGTGVLESVSHVSKNAVDF